MSEYRLDIEGLAALSDYSNIHDYIGLIGDNDTLTISVDAADADNYSVICSMLKDNHFDVASKGGHADGKYYITAYRDRR